MRSSKVPSSLNAGKSSGGFPGPGDSINRAIVQGRKTGDAITKRITRFLPTDVLVGRGTGPNSYNGNVQFRALVTQVLDKFLEDYAIEEGSSLNMKITTEAKATLAKEVLALVKQQKIRFLEKLTKIEELEAKLCNLSTVVLIMNRTAKEDSTRDVLAHADVEEAMDSVAETTSTYSQYRLLSDTRVLSKIKQNLRFQLDCRHRHGLLESGEPRLKKLKTEQDNATIDVGQEGSPRAQGRIAAIAKPISTLVGTSCRDNPICVAGQINTSFSNLGRPLPLSNEMDFSRNHFEMLHAIAHHAGGGIINDTSQQAPLFQPFAARNDDTILLLVLQQLERERLRSQRQGLEALHEIIAATATLTAPLPRPHPIFVPSTNSVMVQAIPRHPADVVFHMESPTTMIHQSQRHLRLQQGQHETLLRLLASVLTPEHTSN